MIFNASAPGRRADDEGEDETLGIYVLACTYCSWYSAQMERGGASRSVVGTATAKDILVMAVGGDWRDARAGVRSGRTDNLLQRWNVYGSAWT